MEPSLTLPIATAEGSAVEFRDMTGPDRAAAYLVAAATGFRKGELAALTPADFDLGAEVPTVRLDGEHTKNGEPAEQPLAPAVVARLRPYLAGRPADQPVWPGTWATRSADMLGVDLDAAKIPAVVRGKEALFHSLRHSYATMLAPSRPR